MTSLPNPHPASHRTTTGGAHSWVARAAWWLDGGAFGPVRRYLAAAVVAVGPWIMFVLTLALISITSAPVLGRAGLEDLRLTVTYAFCFAPFAAGPVGLAAAELARRTRDEGLPLPLYDILRVALVLAGALAALLALAISLLLGLTPPGAALSFVVLSAAAAMLWICFAMMPALKFFATLITGLLGGIALSLAGTFAIVRFAPSIELILGCFAAGLVFCVACCLNEVRHRYAGPDAVPEAFALLRTELWRRRVLAAGIMLALVGVWADKWAFWLSADALTSSGGFLHFSRYDSVMFVAHLSVIPTFASMLMVRETELAAGVKAVQGRLQTLASHRLIRRAIGDLTKTAWTGIFRVLFVQATICGMLVLAAPWIVRAMSFDFEQFLVLRIALVAAFLHGVFYVASVLILMCGRARHFVLTQGIFAASNIALSWIFIEQGGFTAYPLFFSALIASVVAWPIAFRSLATYDFLYLLGENESLVDR